MSGLAGPTATHLIRTLLSTYPFLRTNQIWRLATEGFKPVLPESHQIVDGRIRMKHVSNIREGKRIWVPPPQPRFPDHPFHSTNFLKSKVLASLEEQGLIHKRRILYPHRTEEEAQAAVAQAEKENRRSIRQSELPLRKQKKRLPGSTNTPVKKHPSSFTEEFAWSLGPATYNEVGGLESWVPVEFAGKLKQIETDEEEARRAGLFVKSPSFVLGPTEEELARSPYNPSISPEYKKRWDYAEEIEKAYREAKEIEKSQILKRQEIRRRIHKEQRDVLKREREADKQSGRYESVMREKERLEALARIDDYARQTGEDVSAWYEELGSEYSWAGDEGRERMAKFEEAELELGDEDVDLANGGGKSEIWGIGPAKTQSSARGASSPRRSENDGTSGKDRVPYAKGNQGLGSDGSESTSEGMSEGTSNGRYENKRRSFSGDERQHRPNSQSNGRWTGSSSRDTKPSYGQREDPRRPRDADAGSESNGGWRGSSVGDRRQGFGNREDTRRPRDAVARSESNSGRSWAPRGSVRNDRDRKEGQDRAPKRFGLA